MESQRLTEADLELRMERLRDGMSHIAEHSPEDQQAVLQGAVAEVHLGVDDPMVLKIWPSPSGGTASLEVSPDGGVRTSGTMVEQD
jgi:hypothetical protein